MNNHHAALWSASTSQEENRYTCELGYLFKGSPIIKTVIKHKQSYTIFPQDTSTQNVSLNCNAFNSKVYFFYLESPKLNIELLKRQAKEHWRKQIILNTHMDFNKQMDKTVLFSIQFLLQQTNDRIDIQICWNDEQHASCMLCHLFGQQANKDTLGYDYGCMLPEGYLLRLRGAFPKAHGAVVLHGDHKLFNWTAVLRWREQPTWRLPKTTATELL